MTNLTLEEQKLLDRVESIICDYFNVDTNSIVNNDRRSNVTLARGMIIYMLHTKYGFSANKLANIYFRTRRAIFWHISKIGYIIKKQKTYIKIYEEICNRVE